MTTIYIDDVRSTSAADTSAYTLGANQGLFLASTGALLALGDGGTSSGLYVNGYADGAVVDIQGSVFSQSGEGIYSLGDNVHILIDGRVEAPSSTGVAADGEGSVVTVSSTGYVDGYTGVSLGDSGQLFNGGTIFGAEDTGVQMNGQYVHVINDGTITGRDYAFYIDADNSSVVNNGLINGSVYVRETEGVHDNLSFTNNGTWNGGVSGSSGEDQLSNAGLITGGLSMGGGNDQVANTGAMNSYVDLGAGNDALDSRLGTVAAVFGGDGQDLIYGGAGGEALSGDDGNDTIRGGTGDDTVSGGAQNDVIRAGAGDDLVSGDDQADRLYGQKGDDTLSGGSGSDVLVGGAGDDLLSGGVKSDTFVFRGGFGHDVITDFTPGNVATHDVVQLSHSLFSTFAQVQAHMVQAGSDVVITVSPDHDITLEGVTLGALTSNDFSFVT